jgi:hypothetical protein
VTVPICSFLSLSKSNFLLTRLEKRGFAFPDEIAGRSDGKFDIGGVAGFFFFNRDADDSFRVRDARAPSLFAITKPLPSFPRSRWLKTNGTAYFVIPSEERNLKLTYFYWRFLGKSFL